MAGGVDIMLDSRDVWSGRKPALPWRSGITMVLNTQFRSLSNRTKRPQPPVPRPPTALRIQTAKGRHLLTQAITAQQDKLTTRTGRRTRLVHPQQLDGILNQDRTKLPAFQPSIGSASNLWTSITDKTRKHNHPHAKPKNDRQAAAHANGHLSALARITRQQ
jgi:hypothetical protein